MKYEMRPEEKLFQDIFGLPWDANVPFLPPDGLEAVRRTLDRFTADQLAPQVRQRCLGAAGCKGQILRLRYGFEPRTDEEAPKPYASRTLEEVGAIIGVSRERVRQVRDKALRILRHPKYSTDLKMYVPNAQSAETEWLKGRGR